MFHDTVTSMNNHPDINASIVEILTNLEDMLIGAAFMRDDAVTIMAHNAHGSRRWTRGYDAHQFALGHYRRLNAAIKTMRPSVAL